MSGGPSVAVALPVPVDRLFDYAAPADLFPGGPPPPGALVEAPLGSGRTVGVVWGPGGASWGGASDPPAALKPLIRALEAPPLPEPLRAFIARAADYTLTPIGMMARLACRAPGLGEPAPERAVLRLGPGAPDRMTPARARVLDVLAALGGAGLSPGDLAREAGVSASVAAGLEACGALLRESAPRDAPYPALDPEAAPAALSPAQAAAALAARAAVAQAAAAQPGAGGFSTTLLQGVTGSGKTEVYLEAVAEALARGRQALVMLPEIALTAAFLDRLAARFGAAPAAWHSGVSGAERRRLWRAAASGAAQVVIGARSALFLPFARLGLIVVDEEHEGAYKQEDGALYHARDMAVLRASCEGAAALLASATPSLESWVNAETGRYRRLTLPDRYGPATLPRLAAVDLRRDGPARGRWIAPPLAKATAERLAAGEQTLLFLNRRGYAPLTVCRACGHFFECPDCDARLVEHRLRGKLVCHQCGHAEPQPAACPSCGAADRLAATGPGVERLAEEAAALFPQARVALLSSDTAAGPAALRAQIEEIAGGGADVIIGTQLVAKGHNFPLLTLVGVIDADLGLANGDLRAAERTFQLIRQVSGRAGRAERPGLALIQTAAPEHPVIRAILAGDEEGFLRREAAERQAAGSPPFGRMAAAILSGPDEAKTWEAARALARAGGPLEAVGARLFGPAPAPVARIRGRFRVRLLVKAPRTAPLQPALRAWIAAAPPRGGVRLAVDVDPQSFL
ncbi:primosomal protein N' [Rubrimonas cliftonensis]|uniref:Replication restart protein PriA n=1 Tax=Rubrimonas cliftonensis TaxID=89524 RepID=A0A1H4EVN3_9RHOB|nr:primosomal protein N' [Rubrimonas cliftonensis]SEA88917.1 replication restart DNA helicase PriA [Rubrimonas cliftonensis]